MVCVVNDVGEVILNEAEAIKHVIEEAYIKGVHGDQDERRIRGGFHQDFTMFVLSNNNIQKVRVEDWLGRIEQLKKENPELWKSKTSHRFKLVDVSKNAALAKLDVFKGETHFSTDYMLLYKFEEGWRIVSKIFTIP
ncbi:MAG: nuclear transport factor 2 family protein [Candidatus Bathyarchaeota archaeon]|nr:MAG: nuclear transport factor 2 family protein [Candidatus Bathyarchaeota archaeon]